MLGNNAFNIKRPRKSLIAILFFVALTTSISTEPHHTLFCKVEIYTNIAIDDNSFRSHLISTDVNCYACHTRNLIMMYSLESHEKLWYISLLIHNTFKLVINQAKTPANLWNKCFIRIAIQHIIVFFLRFNFNTKQ